MRTEVKLHDGNLVVYSEDDVEETLDYNHTLRSMPQKSDFMRQMYRIPNIVLVQWMNEETMRGNPVRFLSPEFEEMVSRKMADRDNYKFRVDK